MYYPLHVHTAGGSIGDSILKIKDYIKKAKAMGLDRIAVTNHGSLADMYDFYEAATEADIKPIIGCEVYVADDKNVKTKEDVTYHLVLIAQNEIGMKNLLYIVSDASLNGFYRKPRTDLQTLSEHSEGLICLSACLGGYFPKNVFELSQEELEKQVLTYKTIFKNNFYLEIQPGDFDKQVSVNKELVNLAINTNTPIIATNDVHYLDDEDWYAHDVHVKIGFKKQLDDPMIYPDKCYYLMDEADIAGRFSYLPESVVRQAILNTEKVARSCNVVLNTTKLDMPSIVLPKGFTPYSYLTKLTLETLYNMKDTLNDVSVYLDRALYELEVIEELGFSNYFLTMYDFINYARKNDIPISPGRGSVCGSIVAFLIGIIDVDAVKYNLLFERFLSKHRKGSVPDVDTDFASSRRQEMFDYAIEKHGIDHCALVSTLGIRKAKSAIRDTGRCFEIDPTVVDKVAKLIPTVFYGDDGDKETDLSIEDSLRCVPELRAYQEIYPEWFRLAIKLEDLPRHTSIHAAGTLITTEPLIEQVPLIKKDDEGINATALNLKSAEKAGKIKFDFLGLATLDITSATEKLVGYKFNYRTNAFDDPDVWALIGSKNTTGLFQIASNTYKTRMPRLKPKSIQELAACLALLRGPCISSGADKVYMEIIEGKREVELIHPLYDRVTAATNGIVLYQEQIMNISVNFGFSLEDGFKLMKAVSKKKIEKILEYEVQFRKGADERNVPEEAVDRIWQIILDAGLYCFNESHAVGYALLCYHTAYLKHYYPLEFMTQVITNAFKNNKGIEEAVSDAIRLGFRFVLPDVNKSDFDFTITEDRKIRIGFCAIKGFGEAAYQEVLEKRPFIDIRDCIERTEKNKLKKNNIVPLILCGGFSELDYQNVQDAYLTFCTLRKEEPAEKIKAGKEYVSPFADYQEIEAALMSCNMISNPVSDLEDFDYDNVKLNHKFECDVYVSAASNKKDKNGKTYCIATMYTSHGTIEGFSFADVYAKHKKVLKKGNVLRITAKKTKENQCILITYEKKGE